MKKKKIIPKVRFGIMKEHLFIVIEIVWYASTSKIIDNVGISRITERGDYREQLIVRKRIINRKLIVR